VTGAEEDLIRLACARLGWARDEVEVVGQVGSDGTRPVEVLHPAVQPGRLVLAIAADGKITAQVCALLVARGYGGSEVRALHRLGEPEERMLAGSAARWMYPAAPTPLVLALRCHPDPGTPLLTRAAGLPAAGYPAAVRVVLPAAEVRAAVLAALGPVPGHLLWDVGAASGAVGIEWMRTHPACRAVAVERDPDRADRIAAGAADLGVPQLRVVRGAAPGVLRHLATEAVPDAVFLGCAADRPADRILETCLAHLRPTGRLVATASSPEGTLALTRWYARHGGTLRRIALAEPDGGQWREATPVLVWARGTG
jgi:precorrin-6B C5,15-methyltransferase / cobalt-precorrin-6B C5,C15-methyltransferase